jgi:hypothetical protein
MKNAPSESSSSSPSRVETALETLDAKAKGNTRAVRYQRQIERLRAEITELRNRRQSSRIFQLRASPGIFEWSLGRGRR